MILEMICFSVEIWLKDAMKIRMNLGDRSQIESTQLTIEATARRLTR